MKIVSFTEAKKNFKSILDNVVEHSDYTIISRRDAKDTVVMSLDTFNSLMETLHLLQSPKNAEHLEKSIKEYKQGKITNRDLIDK